ncbi:hypothetical protein NMG60_11037046 [Bertholletia excelsa]
MLPYSSHSHFFKHLSRTAATYFSVPTLHSRLTPLTAPPTLFSYQSSPFMETRTQKRECPLYAAKFSTTAISDVSAASSYLTSSYLTVHIRCRKDVADMLSEALLCFGASSTSMDELDNYQNRNEITISSIFSDCEDVKKCISHAADSIGLKETPIYKVTKGDHSDWIKKSQEAFEPVKITKGLWVVPEWRTPPDLQAMNIILYPGLAFGTGEHPTTKLCLLLLHSLIKGGELFLDYGTGSGILAIAAIKFGATLSVGLDVDPQAITSARQNASLNNIGAEKLQLHLVSSKNRFPNTDEETQGIEGQTSSGIGVNAEAEKYDVVIANILLNPLLDLADCIVSYAKPGAIIGVSGIIIEQIPSIVERYSEFLECISVSKMDGWACISGTKKRDPPA